MDEENEWEAASITGAIQIVMHNAPERLLGAWTRLYRAKENYESLTSEVNEFLYNYVKGMLKGWDPESENFSLQLRHPKDSRMTGRPGALVVDIVEDLRAALDYMVFELSALNKPDLRENIPQFVIADTKDEFANQSRSRLQYLTHQQQTDFVQKLQPFNGNWMLAVLRDLTNQSKHRRLLSLRDNSGWDIYFAELKKKDEYDDCLVYPVGRGSAIFARPKTNCILLLEKYDALKTLKTLAEHVGDIVQLSHCFFEGRPFKMTVIPS